MRTAETTITTIGLDIAKSVFQVHGVDSAGQVVVSQQLKRARVIVGCPGRRPPRVRCRRWSDRVRPLPCGRQ